MAQTVDVNGPDAHGNGVSVSPTATNQNAEYTVTFTVGNGDNSAVKPGSNFSITFPAGTYVPSSISTSEITVRSVAATAVSVSGQIVTITTPVEIGGNNAQENTAAVVIAASAGIRNPASSGTYSLSVTTYPTKGGSATDSETYDITQTTTTISSPAVTPNNSVASNSAAYKIGFSVGAGGYLTTSSTITVKFPSSTTLPSGAVAGVTVNNTSATATASGDSVIINCPVEVANSEAVEIDFSLGSGLKNPSSAGDYHLSVYTSSETTEITSDTYSISSPANLSFTAVGLTDNMVNTVCGYTLDFIVSNTGALTANSDTIIVRFQKTTQVPSSISTSKVVVSSGGFSQTAKAVVVSDTTVKIVTPVTISNSSTVQIRFLETASIRNPAISTNYRLSVETKKSSGATVDSKVISNPFFISPATSTVTIAAVSLQNSATNATGLYTLRFAVGDYGRLVSGTSKIGFIFPSGTAYGSLSSIKINGTSTTAFTRSGDTVKVTLPSAVSVKNNDTLNVQITNITNPGTSGTYDIGVFTTVETDVVSSSTYGIGSKVTMGTITLTDYGSNKTSGYTITASSSVKLSNNVSDFVRIVFPEGVTLPSSIASGNVTLTGQSVTSVSVDQSTRAVNIYVGGNNKNFSNIVINAAAGIQNPSVPSTSYYHVYVSTSQQPPLAASPVYSITPHNSSVTAGTVTSTPNVINFSGASYEVPFTPSAYGRLTGGISGAGSDTIFVDFNTSTIVPSSIAAGNVTVNTYACSDVTVLSSGAGGVVGVVVPDGITLPSSAEAIMFFYSAAGLQNGPTAGTSTVRIYTTVDTAKSTQTNNLTLASSASLAVTAVTNSPSTVNAQVAFQIDFRTGSSGAIDSAQSITIDFSGAGNTYVPSSIAKSLILVNGAALKVNATAVGQTLTIESPIAIGDLTEVTVSISSSAGILNSSTASTSNTLNVSTTAEPTGDDSPSFTTTGATTTISQPNVSLSDYHPSTLSTYTITFSTGTSGSLIGGSSTITLTLPSGTTVPTTLAGAAPLINGTSVITLSGNNTTKTLVLTVPPSVTIGNGSTVTVTVDSLVNPTTETNYTLKARTSVETTDVTSTSYPITSISPVTVSSVTLAAATDTVNMYGSYTIDISNISQTLTSGSGTITIEFPSGTALPVSIATTDVSVGGAAANSVSVNAGTRRVTITVPSNVSTSTSVVFSTSAGIYNPRIYGDYTLRAWTSGQPAPATSGSYTIEASGRTIYNLQVSGSPESVNTPIEWTWSFNVSGVGGLVAGTSKLYLVYNAARLTASVPSTINNSYVTVNGETAPAVTVNTSDPIQEIVEITLPSTVTANNDEQLEVVISSAAGIYAAEYSQSVAAFTSVDTLQSTPIEYGLPVELVSFEAVTTSGDNALPRVKLSWQTATELNNAGFKIFKRQSTSQDEETLASYQTNDALKGLGTSAFGNIYSFVDADVSAGKTYVYRLVDVDYEGNIESHGEVSVTIPLTYALNQNYPNPFNPSTTIQFVLAKDAKTVLEVYDILGRKVRTLLNENLKQGTYTYELNASGLATGIYFYRLTSGKFMAVKKMLLLK
ncbi:T9SS type A sorting domain-containing protein [Chloroherpeton thalassium]|nr:T9SS type A sorting domain-containing protein [Chloroherpeton thalassium]